MIRINWNFLIFQYQEVVPAEATPIAPAVATPIETVINRAKNIVTDTLKFALNIVSILDKHPEDVQSDTDDSETEEEDEDKDGFLSSDSAEWAEEFSSNEELEIDFENEPEVPDDGEEEDESAGSYLEVRSFEIEGRPGKVTVDQFKDVVNEMQKPGDKKKVLFTGFETKSEEVESLGRYGEGQRLDFEGETEESRKQKKKKNKEEPRTKQDSDAKMLPKGAETTTCSEDR